MTLTTSYQKVAEALLGNSGYGNVYVRTYVKYNSQSIENNTSNISIQGRISTVGGYWWSDSGTTYRITGSESIDSGAIGCNGQYNVGETTLGTITKDIKHNDDGSRTIHAESNFTSQPWGWNATASASNLILPTIARASSVSSSSPYIGDNATIIISSASSSFTHTLTYSFGSASGTIASKTSATTVAWDTNAIKASLYAQIPNAKSGSGTITCQTYNGNTLVGTKTCSFNLYAKESDCKPSISGSVVDTNSSTIALTGNSAVMVRYMSKPKVTISATANYSSSIKSYSINVDGQTSNSSSATYNSISSNSITISVTDSRGYSNSKTLTPSMISYVKLTSNLTIARPEQTSSEAYLNGSGQWFNGNFSSSNANTLSINCQYRKSGDSSWTSLGTLTPTKSGNTFNFSNLKLGDSFDYADEYQFQITIADKLQTIGNENKDIITLSVGKPIVRIGKEDVIVNGNAEIVGKLKNVYFDENGKIYWKEGGFGDKFAINPYFSGSDDENLFRIQGAVGEANTDPELYNLMTISGKSGNARIKGNLNVGGNTNTLYSTSTGIRELPKGTDSREYWNRLENGTYWYGDTGNVANMPSSWGWVVKMGFQGDGDFNVLFFTQPQGGIFRKSGHASGVSSWRRIDNTYAVLYDNSSGTNGTVTLNETADNFSCIEIFYAKGTEQAYYTSSRIVSPNGKRASLITGYGSDTQGLIYSKAVNISGTSITTQTHGRIEVINGGANTTNATNYISIYRVVGYR